MDATRTVVTFRSASFNDKESKSHFINPDNYGDDVALWLAGELEKRNIRIERKGVFPGQEDFGWYFNFVFGNSSFCLVVGSHHQGDGFEWIIWVERRCSFLENLVGGRQRHIPQEVPQMVHSILTESSTATNIIWHNYQEFKRGVETTASANP